ncbi:tetratricopeptide repeat protein 5 isoform X2 [Caloenas nicobarica]
MEATLQLMDQVTVPPSSRARALLLRAQALAVAPQGAAGAEQALGRAVKLEPRLSRAWTRLGELRWRRGDLRGAHDCFRGALQHGEDAEARRLLSMVLRAGGGDRDRDGDKDNMGALRESRDQAEAAVRCDPRDGSSWYVLGNAYVSLFFAGGQNPQDAQRALGAYAQAERVDPKAANNPDLHLNRATLLQYQERFGAALDGLSRAAALAPGWAEPRRRHAHLLDFLERLRAALANRVRPRGGRSRRGLEVGGAAAGGVASEGLRPLRPGANPGQVLSGRVLFTLSPPERVPLALGVAVGGGAVAVVTVYNAAPGWGVGPGEGLGVPNPHLTLHQHLHQGQTFSFPGIRVSSPLSLLVNGKRPPPSALAPPRLALSAPPPLPDTPPAPQ